MVDVIQCKSDTDFTQLSETKNTVTDYWDISGNMDGVVQESATINDFADIKGDNLTNDMTIIKQNFLNNDNVSIDSTNGTETALVERNISKNNNCNNNSAVESSQTHCGNELNSNVDSTKDVTSGDNSHEDKENSNLIQDQTDSLCVTASSESISTTVNNLNDERVLNGDVIEDGNIEDRFRVDRKKLEQMLQPKGEGQITIGEDFFKKIMTNTNTDITWPSKLKIGAKSKKDPHIRITGKPEDVKSARQIIMQSLDTKNNRVTIKMDVSHTEHSHVIGKGGNNIKRVMEDTGCHIHFPDSNRNNAVEKSNQVSITGHPEGVENAREKIRNLLPIVVMFDLPNTNSRVADPNSPVIQHLVQAYSISIQFKQRAKLFPITCIVRGSPDNVARLKEGTKQLMSQLVGNELTVSTQIEIAPQHHSYMLAKSGQSLSLTQGARIVFPNPSTLPKKSTVYINGAIDSVILARETLMGCLPIILMFDFKDESNAIVDNAKITNLMKTYDVTINIKPKPKQPSKTVIIKSVESKILNMFLTRKEMLGLSTSGIVEKNNTKLSSISTHTPVNSVIVISPSPIQNATSNYPVIPFAADNSLYINKAMSPLTCGGYVFPQNAVRSNATTPQLMSTPHTPSQSPFPHPLMRAHSKSDIEVENQFRQQVQISSPPVSIYSQVTSPGLGYNMERNTPIQQMAQQRLQQQQQIKLLDEHLAAMSQRQTTKNSTNFSFPNNYNGDALSSLRPTSSASITSENAMLDNSKVMLSPPTSSTSQSLYRPNSPNKILSSSSFHSTLDNSTLLPKSMPTNDQVNWQNFVNPNKSASQPFSQSNPKFNQMYSRPNLKDDHNPSPLSVLSERPQMTAPNASLYGNAPTSGISDSLKTSITNEFIKSLTSNQFNPPNITLTQPLNEVTLQDLRHKPPPGFEGYDLDDKNAQEKSDYELHKKRAVEARQKIPVTEEVRYPNDYFSGFHFSQSMPEPMLKQLAEIGAMKPSMLPTTYEKDDEEGRAGSPSEEDDKLSDHLGNAFGSSKNASSLNTWRQKNQMTMSLTGRAGFEMFGSRRIDKSAFTPIHNIERTSLSPQNTLPPNTNGLSSSPLMQSPSPFSKSASDFKQDNMEFAGQAPLSRTISPIISPTATTDLSTILNQLDLSKFIPNFEQQEVDYQTFLTLTDSDLKEIGIKTLGPRKKILSAIQNINNNSDSVSVLANDSSAIDNPSDHMLQMQRLQLQQQRDTVSQAQQSGHKPFSHPNHHLEVPNPQEIRGKAFPDKRNLNGGRLWHINKNVNTGSRSGRW